MISSLSPLCPSTGEAATARTAEHSKAEAILAFISVLPGLKDFRLEHGRAAVDDERLAGDEGGVGAREEAHRAHQVLGLLVALDGARQAGALALFHVFLFFGNIFRQGKTRRQRV